MDTRTLQDHINTTRALKAERIAATLRRSGLTAVEAAHLTIAERRGYEVQADVRLGSALTWRLVVDMLAGSVRVPCPTCGHGDPEGVFGPVREYGHEGPCSI